MRTGTREEWLAARLELLDAEKELTRRSDELARQRQELPWVRSDKDYRFETDEGSASLADLKTGDVLAVTSAVGKDETRLTAIKLAAGVDLVLKAMTPQPGKPQLVRLSAGLPAVFDFSVVPIN